MKKTQCIDDELRKELIKIFQDVIDNRGFELSYDEIQEIIAKLKKGS